MSSQIENPGGNINAAVAMALPYLAVDRAGNLCDGTVGVYPFGLTQNVAPSSGVPVPARFPAAGTFKAQAAGAIAVGQRVYTAAAGQVSKTASGIYLGRARTAATAQNDVIEIEPPAPRSAVLNEIIAASAVITNVGVETTFSNGSFTLPANELQPGDILDVDATIALVARNATDTQRVRLYLGSTALLDTGAIGMAAADFVRLYFRLLVRTDGATGTILGDGQQNYNLAGTDTFKSANLVSTTIDTTSGSANIIKVTALASAANAGNQIRLDRFDITRVNPG